MGLPSVSVKSDTVRKTNVLYKKCLPVLNLSFSDKDDISEGFLTV